MGILDQEICSVFTDGSAKGESVACGINGNGYVEFGSWDDKGNYFEFFHCTRATFDAVCKQLGQRPPMFEDQMKSYLDEKFTEVKKIIEVSTFKNPIVL